jgi:hypothetical protein
MKLLYPRDTSQIIVHGTDTFRLGHRKILSNKQDTPYNNFGGNRANIERGLREVWEADNGMLFVQPDQAGAEALIVAYLCKPGRYRMLFENGVKPHTYLGMKLFPDVWKRHLSEAEVNECLKAEIPQLKTLASWRTLADIIASSDDWPSAQRYYHMAKKTIHCIDSETEVLTPDGWLKVDTYTNQPIMVYGKDFKMHFEVPAAWNSFDYDGPMIHFNETNLDQLVTPNHTIRYFTNGVYKDANADYLAKYRGARVPTTGMFSGGSADITPDEARLVAAIQADGSIQGKHTVVFHFGKSRKCARIKELLNKLKIPYEETHEYSPLKEPVYTRYRIRHVERYIDWLDDKKFNFRMLAWSRSALDALLNELQYWDGTVHRSLNYRKQVGYHSTGIENIEFIKTLCHLSNSRASYSCYKGCYDISIQSKRTLARLNWKNSAGTSNYAGKVYCPTTSTGYFLIRRNGKISITGNSGSYGMKETTFRNSIIKESNGTIVLSHTQASHLLRGFHTEFPEIQNWHIRTYEILRKKGQLRNLMGYPYNITTMVKDNDYRDFIAWIPQSTVACITRNAYCDMQDYIEANHVSWHLLTDTHDSYMGEAPGTISEDGATIAGESLECGKKMKSFLEVELVSPLDGVKFKMKSDCSIGANWGYRKEHKDGTISNPFGLRKVKL